ncbi:kinesin heavy chain, putative [Entamoeba invadens IP1]|uniref:Kinesin heavy chain, putative n=1 Tax=Entamoeba invadens IP1 TaxID=370355 RepID=A0A0A1UHD1_ENTIV|nr:kinesin heavy chain, putative [Entamoeba invadens IP1]ELP95112.1 kinesin heavy chain, putative [Entamoeba invadens IP1]|eukprot:XP_004261883.1 kinesin heavy chain, putative [Entamoeba invadens IP1]
MKHLEKPEKAMKVIEHIKGVGTQEHFYASSVQPIITNVVDGADAYVLCCGFKNSGKTYTLEGKFTDLQFEDAGVIPRAMKSIFAELKKKEKYVVRVSFLQISENSIEDLLCEEKNKVIIKDAQRKFKNALGGVIFSGASEMSVNDTNTPQIFSKLNELRDNKFETPARNNDFCKVFVVTVISSINQQKGPKELVNVGRLTFVMLPSFSFPQNKMNMEILKYAEATKEQRLKMSLKLDLVTKILQEGLGGQGMLLCIGCIDLNSENNQAAFVRKFLSKMETIKNDPVLVRQILKTVYENYLDDEIKQLEYRYNDLIKKNAISKEVFEAKKIQQEIQTQKYANVQIGSAIQKVRKDAESEYLEINSKIQKCNEYIKRKKQTESEIREKIVEMLAMAQSIQEHNTTVEEMIKKQLLDNEKEKAEIKKSVSICKFPNDWNIKIDEQMKCFKETIDKIKSVVVYHKCDIGRTTEELEIGKAKDLLDSIFGAFKKDIENMKDVVHSVFVSQEKNVENFVAKTDAFLETLNKKSEIEGFETFVKTQIENLKVFISELETKRKESLCEIERKENERADAMKSEQTNFKTKIEEVVPLLKSDVQATFEKYQKEIFLQLADQKRTFDSLEIEHPNFVMTEEMLSKITAIQKDIATDIMKKKESETIQDEFPCVEFLDESAFKKELDNVKGVVSKIFEETGIVASLKNEEVKLFEKDKEMSEEQIQLNQFIEKCCESLDSLKSYTTRLLRDFEDKIDMVSVEFESQIEMETMQSPHLPSLLQQNSEMPTVLEDLSLDNMK